MELLKDVTGKSVFGGIVAGVTVFSGLAVFDPQVMPTASRELTGGAVARVLAALIVGAAVGYLAYRFPQVLAIAAVTSMVLIVVGMVATHGAVARFTIPSDSLPSLGEFIASGARSSLVALVTALAGTVSLLRLKE
ncbi:MAG: hypothetical protein LBH13_04165 [Cellulomonadaceae bacterium]|nr:hypothetical protein [Cellulomonadaceae bacterium]